MALIFPRNKKGQVLLGFYQVNRASELISTLHWTVSVVSQPVNSMPKKSQGDPQCLPLLLRLQALIWCQQPNSGQIWDLNPWPMFSVHMHGKQIFTVISMPSSDRTSWSYLYSPALGTSVMVVHLQQTPRLPRGQSGCIFHSHQTWRSQEVSLGFGILFSH